MAQKSPYPKTFDPKYLALIRSRMEALLAQPDAPLFYLVSRDGVRSLMETEQPWPWYGQLMRLPQTLAYFLQLDFWLRHNRVELLW